MDGKTESIRQYYERIGMVMPADVQAGSHFNVRRRTYCARMSPYNRRDYYKVCLVIGKLEHITASRRILIDKPSIVFSSPSRATSFQTLSEEQSGYSCIFNDAFLLNGLRQEIRHESPLFNDTLDPVYTLAEDDVERFLRYFTDMETLQASDYNYKYDMVRNLLYALIHEGIRLNGPQPGKTGPVADRVISRFYNLLDQQFPVDSPESPLKLMTPSAYADQLNVHVNHLNNVVKKATGKTTREVIHERIIAEAKVLLINTDWDAAEIAYALGFEYPSHFNKYFKQYTLTTPLLFRETSRMGEMVNV